MLKISRLEAITILMDPILTNADKRIFGAIALCRSERPSRARIGKACGISVPNVSRSVTRLSDLGYLQLRPLSGHTTVYSKGRALTRIKSDTPTRIRNACRSPVSNPIPKLLELSAVNSETEQVPKLRIVK